MGYIYCITNKVNNKKYIGQTTGSYKNRFQQHMTKKYKEKKYKPIITKAVEKYGRENFCVDVLEKCENNLLDEKEIYWISKLNTFEDGYNQTQGGQGGKKISLKNKKKIEKTFLKTFDIPKTAQILGKEKSTIREHLKNMGYSTRDIQIYKNVEKLEKYIFIKEIYEKEKNIRKTAKIVGMERRSVSRILKKVGIKTKSFEELSKETKSVLKLDPKTKCVLKEYASLKEASKDVGIHYTSISHVCDDENKKAGGFFWKTS